MNTAQHPHTTSLGRWLSQAYGLFRILSLDVALGSLGAGWMVARVLELPMGWAWYVCLPIAVWLIYTLDHLMDAHRVGADAHTERHLFHHHHFWPLMGIWLVLAPICLMLALVFLPVEGVYFGLAMSGLVAGHLLLVKLIGDTTAPWLMKELGVGLIYALGIWGLPLWLKGSDLQMQHFLYLLQFWLLAMVNLLEFSIFEYKIDELDGHTSFVRAIGPAKASRTVWIMLTLVGLLGGISIIGAGSEAFRIQIVLGSMAVLLAWILADRKRFTLRERYRLWGDAAFLLPFIYPLL